MSDIAAPPGFMPLDAPPGFLPVNEQSPTVEMESSIIQDEDDSITDEPLSAGVSLEELSGGFLTRPIFETVGGITGAVIGGGGAIPSGPGAVGGVIVGGSLGAAAGSTTFDATEGVLRMLGMVTTEEPSIVEKSKQALNAAALEMGFGTVATVARPVLMGRRLLEKVFGLRTPESLDLQALARNNGVDIGAMDVGGQFPRLINATMNVFPVTGEPARRAVKGKFQQVNTEIHRRLNTLAPNATGMSELGIDMVKAAKGARAEFKFVADDLYKNFEGLAESASKIDIIPTENVKSLAAAFKKDSDLERIFLEDQKALDRPTANAAQKFLEDLQNISENITIHQYKGLKKDLSDLFGMFEGQGASTAKLMDMKKALEGDLNSIRADLLPEGEGDALVAALETANNFYSKGIVEFQTSVANKFKRVDRNMFRSGAEKPGTIDADELAHVVINMRSPKTIEALSRLVGDEPMQQAARNIMDHAVSESTSLVRIGKDEVPVFDPSKLSRMLKLEGPKSEGLRALLKKTGVDPDDLSDFLKVAGGIESVGDASAFAARRTAMAGTGGIKGLLGLGVASAAGGAAGGPAGAGAGVIAAAAVTLMGRWASKIVADPRKLKLITAALDKQRSQATRQAALGAVLNLLVQEARGGRTFAPNDIDTASQSTQN